MADLLRPDRTILTASGKTCTVEHLLGSGSQGEVYRARLSGRKDPVALKWYYLENIPGTKEDQYFNLEKLIKAGSPDERFLWPLDLCTAPDVPGFGYIMPLREPRFKSINDWMFRKVNPTFEALTTAGYLLACSFYNLHSRRYCYRDINFGNVFFDPKAGDVEICDNDNVTVDTNTKSLVLGTPDFMAPEIITSKAMPDKDTDLHSLAILLFYMFFLNHPFYGKRVLSIHCLDAVAKNELCCYHPVFIFDPVNDTNRAVYLDKTAADACDNAGAEAGGNAIEFWGIYPEFFKALFVRAFTQGTMHRVARVRESEWKNAFVQLRDLIVKCPHCKVENFYEQPRARTKNGVEYQECWHCKRDIKIPGKMRLSSQDKTRNAMITLYPGKKLYPHHLDETKAHDFTTPYAQVILHPEKKIVGLMNLSPTSWKVTNDAGEKTVDPKGVIPLKTGQKISFGTMDAEVKIQV